MNRFVSEREFNIALTFAMWNLDPNDCPDYFGHNMKWAWQREGSD